MLRRSPTSTPTQSVSAARGRRITPGTWVARRHEITYFLAATYGDELELTTEVAEMRGARAIRNTVIRLVEDGRLVVEMQTEWVWVRLSDGRPTRIPATAVEAFGLPRGAQRNAGGHVSGP